MISGAKQIVTITERQVNGNMTIDEVKEKASADAEFYINQLKFFIGKGYIISDVAMNQIYHGIKYNESIVRLLEELKDYMNKNKLVVTVDCKNLDEMQLKIKEVYSDGYNKAIDDFLEKIKWEYLNSCGIKQKEIEFLVAVASQVAEQLKEGGGQTNDN